MHFNESHAKNTEPVRHSGIFGTVLRVFNQDDDMVLSMERIASVVKHEDAELSPATPTGWLEVVGTPVDK